MFKLTTTWSANSSPQTSCGRRLSHDDFELEVDQDNGASLPTIMKLLITCHFPFVLWCVKTKRRRVEKRKNYRKGGRMKEGG